MRRIARQPIHKDNQQSGGARLIVELADGRNV